ncbi:hypothetical protein Ptr902_04392 [Pyrenophora tritici-repentis]|nr:hypothetical protein Alg130_11503 [Pyrenophora tritici-repentis]KAI2485452.1 hypothetical protein Ptr902_04392 [Pyrenophora tritici-repentis]
MVSFITITLFAASAIASACAAPGVNSASSSNNVDNEIPQNWNWHVEHWGAGCEHTICNYQFNITVPSIEGVIGGAKAYCQGLDDYTNESPTYVPCKILDGSSNTIAARLFIKSEKRPNPDKIDVSYYYVSSKYHLPTNYSGTHDAVYNQFGPEGPLNFDITPTKSFVQR